MSPLIVLVNGPPGSGKDTLADHLLAAIPGAVKRRMAHELKVRTHRLYACPRESWDDPDFYERFKNEPLDTFLGLTPRQAYIAVSETYFKPIHGDDCFGHMLADWIERHVHGKPVLVPDSGFAGETQVLIDRFGAERVILLRVHAEHRGSTFESDSRSYIYPAGVEAWDLQNQQPDDTKAFLAQGERMVAARLADKAEMVLAAEAKQQIFEQRRAAARDARTLVRG